MNQAPLPKPPKGGGRKAALNSHAKALASGNPFLHQAAITHLQTMNPTDKEIHYVRQRAQKLSVAKNPRILPATRSGVGGPGVRGGNPLPGIGHAIEHAAKQVYEVSPFSKDSYLQARGNKQAMARESKAGAGVAEALTGYKEIKNIAHNPVAGGFAIAGIIPGLGGAGKILDEARAAEAGVKAAKGGEGLRGALAARQAAKAAKRIAPIASHAERDAHLTELAKQAMEEAQIRDRVAQFRHESTVKILEPGHVSPETGGEAGAKIRQGLRPDFNGLGKYEKIGAKLDNPGAAEVRKQQEELRSVARQEKAAKLRAAQKQSFAAAKASENPLKTAAGARSVLAGALPAVKFNGFSNLTHADQLSLIQHIESLDMYPHDKDRLLHAISAGIEGKPPTPAEQTLMERAFGRERPDTGAVIKAGGLKNAALQIASIPRALKSAGDLSWGFRQGLMAAAYKPKEFGKVFAGMFKPAFNEAEAQARMAAIAHHPYFPLLVKMGVPFTDLGSAAHGALNISDKEEAIMSNWAEHLHEAPGIRSTPGVKQAAKLVSKGVRASDRGYVVPLNEIRFALGSQLLHTALETGWNVDGKLGKDLGGLIGALTGRGSLPGFLAKHRATINALFFSPGLMSARMHMLSPFYYGRLEPFARQQALRAARNLTGSLFAVLFAARMAGAKVVTDPRNSDFGKIRIGNTRIDVAGGFSQYLTLASRLGSQTTISSTSGKKKKLSGNFGGTSDWDVVTNFFVNKMSPVFSEGAAIAKQSRFGQPLTPQGEAANLFAPLLWSDVYQEASGSGPGTGPGMAAATFLPDLFGVGIQNYAPPKKKGRSGSSGSSGNPYGGSSGGSSGNPYGGGSSGSSGNPYG